MCLCLGEKIDCKIQLQVWAGGRVLKKKNIQKQINSVDVIPWHCCGNRNQITWM